MKRNGLRIAGVLLVVLAIALWNQRVREGFESKKLAYAENEGGTVHIRAPDGLTITEVMFASYGNPTGSNGDFQKGSCHADTSEQIVKDRCLGKPLCIVPATNDVFGDPCPGTGKRLYVTVNASSPASSTQPPDSTPSSSMQSTPPDSTASSSMPSTPSSTDSTSSSSMPSSTDTTTTPPTVQTESTTNWTTIAVVGGVGLLILGAIFMPLGGSPQPVMGARRVK